MVIIRRCRGELPRTATTGRRARSCGHPTTAVLPRNVNKQIRLHATRVVTARARVLRYSTAGRGGSLRMGLDHVLLEAALLDEALRAHTTHVRQLSGMLLHVIEHRILALLGNSAIGADKLTCGVAQIGHLGRGYGRILNSRHCVVAPIMLAHSTRFQVLPSRPS